MDTITYSYAEGFEELECHACGYRSDEEELAALQRYSGDLLEGSPEDGRRPRVPFKAIEA